MPLLEQPRRSHSPFARFPRQLTTLGSQFLINARRNWPLLWLVCQMTGFQAGVRWHDSLAVFSEEFPQATPQILIRTTAILPVFLGVGGVVGPALVWSGVVLGNMVAAALQAEQRQRRQCATVADSWSPAIPTAQDGAAVMRICGWSRPGKNGRWSAPARLLAWQAQDSQFATAPRIGAGVYLSGKEEPPTPGSVVTGLVTLRVPPVAPLPGAFDYRQFLAGRGLGWQARARSYCVLDSSDIVARVGRDHLTPIRHGILQRLSELLPPREAQLAGAVLLGARTSDSRAISAPFGSLGMAHLFAVSGLHVGILLGIILLPGRWLGWSPRWSVGPLWLFLPLYFLLTGLPGSVVRAGGMGLLIAHAKPLGRRVDTLRLLGLLFWAGSVWDPSQNQDTGLQLSYLATGGILLLGRGTGSFNLGANKWFKPIVTGLLVSFAAQWFTMPVVARSFGQISLLSPVANLITVPVFALAIWATVLALLGSVVWLPVGQDVAAVGWLLLRSINGAVAWVAEQTGGASWGLNVPGIGQDSGWFLLTGALLVLLWWRRDCRRAWPIDVVVWGVLPVFLIQLFGPAARTLNSGNDVVVWQFDVGQGDCSLVSFPDGWQAIIDTGGRYGHRAPPQDGAMGRNILPFMRRQGIDKIEAVILTHGHFDHTGGALVLLEDIDVTNWYVAGRADFAIAGNVDSTLIKRPVSGVILHQWRDWQLKILYPLVNQAHAESENNWSMVVALRRNQWTQMVWSGDLELAGEAALVAADSVSGPTRVWKAGHHGSNTSGSPALLQWLQPELVLISCGVGNSYGHPSHGPYLLSQGARTDTIPLLRTDLQGSIRLQWHANGALDWQTQNSHGQMGPAP